jgi:hypothetical protein
MLVDPSNSGAGARVAGAIRQASQATGASFNYLLATAQVESGLDPQAGASTSSARGLFQFIEQTWLATMKQSGGALGYGRYADAIKQTASGRYEVTDQVVRNEIPEAAQRSDRQRGHGRRLYQHQRGGAHPAARPRAERGRTLHRALSRQRRRRAADRDCGEQSDRQGY